MQDFGILIGFLISFVICIIAIPSIIKVAISKGLYGINRKKTEKRQNVPTLGGLAIFAGILVSLNLFTDFYSFPELPYITAGAIGLFFIGLKDDILVTAPWWKLLGQILAALVICIPGGLRIQAPGSLLGLAGGGENLEVLITVLLIITIINSYNLIDGIDGLAAGIGMLSSIVFGIIFYRDGLTSWALMSAAIVGSLMGFLWYNVFSRRKKIYMGDTGSLLLGFLLSIMSVRFLNIQKPHGLFIEIQTPLALVLAVFIIPLFDTLRIIIVRIVQGHSPFRPDRQHIHYRMVDLNLSHRMVTGILTGLNFVMIILVVALQDLGELILIGLLVLMTLILSTIPTLVSKRKRSN